MQLTMPHGLLLLSAAAAAALLARCSPAELRVRYFWNPSSQDIVIVDRYELKRAAVVYRSVRPLL